jgi:Na+-driven multidrug efflux pump
MNAILRAGSKPKQAMLATIFTVVMNIILDYFFIMVFHWGIKGAAYATVISQVIALIWQIWVFSNKKELLHFKRGIYGLKKDIVKNIIGVGISPFAMNVCACVVVIFINQQLVHYGNDLDVGAYGISNKIGFIFVMFVMGVNQGMQPIAGYNYGAQQLDRMMHVVKLAIIVATIIMTIGWLIAMFIPYYCSRLFTKDATLIGLGIKAIRINLLAFPIVGCQMVITNFFQSIGKVKISIFLSLSRQLLLLLPLLATLPLIYGVNGVWYAMPTSDVCASIIAAFMMMAYMKKFKKQHKNMIHGRQENNN